MNLTGFIRKGIGGFYYVETDQGIYECTARGKFRKARITPYAGDHVTVETSPDMTGVITEIHPRRNDLVRPPVANLDQLMLIISMVSPAPNLLLMDRTIAAAELRGIDPVVVITKLDLQEEPDAQRLKEIYDLAGIPCYLTAVPTGVGLKEVKALFSGKVTVLTGNSGAGKSTLLNALFPGMNIKTGETSEKLGRGRHTTREVEMYPLAQGGYVADTPGFSTFDLARYKMDDKDQLVYGFREFQSYLGSCQFSGCSHTTEQGCAILQALQNQEISRSRFESYCAMYEEVKDVKQWQRNKNV